MFGERQGCASAPEYASKTAKKAKDAEKAPPIGLLAIVFIF
jgi:hypothetical protein